VPFSLPLLFRNGAGGVFYKKTFHFKKDRRPCKGFPSAQAAWPLLSVIQCETVTQEALSYYENGKREPSLALLVAMSQYFNVSIHYLITGEEFEKK